MDDQLLTKSDPNNSLIADSRPAGIICSYKTRLFIVAIAVVSALTCAIWLTVDFKDDEGGSSSRDYWVETMSPTYQVVESIPVSLYDLKQISSSVATHEAEIRMLNGAKDTIDVTAMYWNLLPAQDQKNCNETNGGLPYERCIELGGDRGEAVYKAFEEAAERGVEIRFLLSYGLNETKQSFVPKQVTDLTSKYDNVNYRIWKAMDWYNGGIMHQKLWVVDDIHVYLGSSNMDWLSLAQVKEMGIVMWNSTLWGGESSDLFDTWWGWCGLIERSEYGESVSPPLGELTRTFFSLTNQKNLTVPCWSHHLDEEDRCEYPTAMLPSHIPHNSKKPMSLTVSSASSPSSSSPSSFFLSSAPFETVGANPHHSSSRTFDLDGIVHTIQTAKSYVKLSVMDFAPSNAYDLNWWGTLNDALLAATYGSTVDVQLLISYWAHTAPGMVEYLDALKSQSNVCVANNSTCGSFEVRGRARRSKKERGGAQDRRGTR